MPPIAIKHAICILEKEIRQMTGGLPTIATVLTQQCMNTDANANKYFVLT
jgi:hypothetical protein